MPSTSENSQEIPDPQVRDAGDQYDNARRILEAQAPGSGILLPLLNNSIMAVELYLKSLSASRVVRPMPHSKWSKIYAKPKQRGHNLRELLDAIPDELRERLERGFRERHSGELVATLCSYEGLLSESRYAYEESCGLGRYPLGPLMTVSAFLRDFVANVNPLE